jgi:hypothetical protein
MKNTSSNSLADTIISQLHRVREEIVASFDGDLRKLTEDAQRRQQLSGRPIWRREDQFDRGACGETIDQHD